MRYEKSLKLLKDFAYDGIFTSDDLLPLVIDSMDAYFEDNGFNKEEISDKVIEKSWEITTKSYEEGNVTPEKIESLLTKAIQEIKEEL